MKVMKTDLENRSIRYTQNSHPYHSNPADIGEFTLSMIQLVNMQWWLMGGGLGDAPLQNCGDVPPWMEICRNVPPFKKFQVNNFLSTHK